jgi:hypothetical protein
VLTKIQSSLLKQLLSTKPAERPRAEAALAAIYPIILKRPAPKHLFWFDSPERAGWAVKLLDAAQERMWAGFVELESRRPERRQFLDGVRAELCDHAGLKWEKLTKVAGWHRIQQTSFNLERIESHGRMEFFMEAARQDHPLHDDWKRKMSPFFGGPKRGNEVWRVEKRYRAAILGACGHEMSYNHTQQSAYTFALMAEDQEFVASSGRAVTPAIAAAWEFVRSAGECWVFEGAVVLLDRPAKVRLNSENFLHCEDGPAVVFRDGTKIWARNGRVNAGPRVPGQPRRSRWDAFCVGIEQR